jgi:hypothetical protein
MAVIWRVAQVMSPTPATGAVVEIVAVSDPPIPEYVAAWRAAGWARQENPNQIYIVIEASE